ncbi:MAG: gamma-glutamyltransferase [Myxococcaceae bacterium]
MKAFVPWTLALCLLLASRAPGEPLYAGGAVATAYPLATDAAVAMMNAGGTAADAAAAAAFVLAVVAPYHSGLGGGGFAVSYDAASQKVEVLDFREVAPTAATRDMFVRNGQLVPHLSRDGALSVAVPGAVAGYVALQKAHGRLTRSQVLAPAIAAAKNGFAVTPLYARLAKERLECLRQHADSARLFLRPDEKQQPQVPLLGTRIVQPELMQLLRAIAHRGAAVFYQGRTAAALVTGLRNAGGLLTEADLRTYKTRPREPLWGSYRGHRMVTLPPPSAGGVSLLQTLGVWERRFPNGFAFHAVDALHVYAETLKRSFADRIRWMGDPDFTPVPVADLLSPQQLDRWAKDVDLARAATLPQAVPEPEASKNTTHISVLDKHGNAVSLTTTVNYAFGSCLTPAGTGVLLNNQMDDFAAQPGTPNAFGLVTGEANAVAAGKVPLSSMTPTLVFHRDSPQSVFLVVGSPGGPTISTTVAQVISNVIDAGMDATRAVAAGRLHHQLFPDELFVETWAAEPKTLEALEQKGHRLFRRYPAWGSVNLIRVDPLTRLVTAAADPRGEGSAGGQP